MDGRRHSQSVCFSSFSLPWPGGSFVRACNVSLCRQFCEKCSFSCSYVHVLFWKHVMTSGVNGGGSNWIGTQGQAGAHRCTIGWIPWVSISRFHGAEGTDFFVIRAFFLPKENHTGVNETRCRGLNQRRIIFARRPPIPFRTETSCETLKLPATSTSRGGNELIFFSVVCGGYR